MVLPETHKEQPPGKKISIIGVWIITPKSWHAVDLHQSLYFSLNAENQPSCVWFGVGVGVGCIKHKGFRNSALAKVWVWREREMGGFILASDQSLGIVRKWEGSQLISTLTCNEGPLRCFLIPFAEGPREESHCHRQNSLAWTFSLMSRFIHFLGSTIALSLAHHDEDWLAQSIPPNTHQFS